MNDRVKRVVELAKKWSGRHFHPGQEAQCAAFVRFVFSEAGFNLPNVSRPSDSHLLPQGTPFGPGYADSFAGNETGVRIKPEDLLPGDIIMFPNTYGSYAAGVITHVGIYVGNGMMVDRPTANKPVQLRSIWTFGSIAEIRRPYCLYNGMPSMHRAKMFFHDGVAAAFSTGHKTDFMDVRISMKPTLKVQVNHQVVNPKAITFEAQEMLGGKRTKIFYHDGILKAFVGGVQVHDLEVRAQLAGRVQCWVNGKETNPCGLKLEVVS